VDGETGMQCFCYTSESQIAKWFDFCVTQIGVSAGNDTRIYSDCGYINYKALGSKRGAGRLEREWGKAVLV
jgi:hypothetical protein